MIQPLPSGDASPEDDARLRRLREALAQPLDHPDAATLRAHGLETLDWVLHHFTTLPEQTLGRTASRSQMEALLREPPPELGQAFSSVLGEFADHVASYAFRTTHPRFLAFIPGAPSFLSVLGEWLCSGTNFFAGVWLEAPGPSEVELIVLDWFKEFLGYPAEARGIITSGGSEANLTALVAAREPLSWDERGRAVIYLSTQRHWSMDRAAKVAGFRPEQLRPVADDRRGRLQPESLRLAVAEDRAAGRRPWLVVANAGTTDTGAVDPLDAVSDLCRHEKLWLHVDAAYGWSAALLPEGKELLRGIERADSITLDPHKWFGQTFEAGCVLVRDGMLLPKAFAHRPAYMQDVRPREDEINFDDHSLALTRRFRSLKIWMSLKVLGVGWHRELVRRCCRLAELAAILLEQAGCFEVLSPPQLSIICFRYLPPRHRQSAAEEDDQLNRLNLALVEELRRTGRAFISSTRLDGRVAIRFCFVNWRTTAGDLEEIIGLLAQLGGRLSTTS